MGISLKLLTKDAHWVAISSLIAGLGNYLVLLLILKVFDTEAVGAYRLGIALFFTLGLFSMIQCNRILIREIVLENYGIIITMVKWRLLFSLMGVIAGLVFAYLQIRQQNGLAMPFAIVAFCVPVYFVADMFTPINNAKKQYKRNAIYVCTRQTITVLAILISIWAGIPTQYLMCVFTIVMSALGVLFLAIEYAPYRKIPASNAAPVFNGLTISISQFLVDSLEHVDKFLVSSFLGIGGLGQYAIGVSSGRLLYFAMKPLQTLLAPHMVQNRLTRQDIIRVIVIGTLIGVISSIALYYPLRLIIGPENEISYWIAVTIMVGAGLYSAGQLVFQSSVLREGAPVIVPTITNLITPVFIIGFLVASYFLFPNLAIFAFAASYPLRYTVFIVVIFMMMRLVRRFPSLHTVKTR